MKNLKFYILFSISITSCFCLAQDVLLSTQAEVDDFDPNTTEIKGSLWINGEKGGDPIIDISNLSNLISIDSSLLIIQNDSLDNVNDLSNLISLGGDLLIQDNHSLTNVDGFSNITSINRGLWIVGNIALMNIDGLSSITSINDYLSLQGNHSLINIDGLFSLASINGNLNVLLNSGLKNIDGLYNLERVDGIFRITNNPNLTDCCGIQQLLLSSEAITGSIIILNNPSECSTETEVLNSNCSIVGINEEIELKQLHVYPNPSRSEINVESTRSWDRFVVYDVMGKVILSKDCPSVLPEQLISFEEKLNAGIYFITFYNRNNPVYTHRQVMIN